MHKTGARKAQGLSLNTIVIAVIVLVVLVVLIAIFTGRIGVFNTGVTKCPTQNSAYTCPGGQSCPNDAQKAPFTCYGPGNTQTSPTSDWCCVKLSS